MLGVKVKKTRRLAEEVGWFANEWRQQWSIALVDLDDEAREIVDIVAAHHIIMCWLLTAPFDVMTEVFRGPGHFR
jgi:hypothetical protein